ncbi:MAG: 4Fe-4S dicluster domain-containing protein, partial [Planctomycetota bacterium]|nr:4Fe-4S dicluster domain-containing protein [Planctomycetota bacterium]
SELLGESRRTFLKVMSASLALAGVALMPGCRRPEHKIMPYARDPEHIIPGKALYYATAMACTAGSAEGLLVETHDGRPTKIEGNPLHAVNNGKSSVHAQAAILDLYDPERLGGPTRLESGERTSETWQAFADFAQRHFQKFDSAQGRGLAFLVEKSNSPSRAAMRDRMKQRWPQAKWLPYEAIDNEASIEGSRAAFGAPHRELLSLEKASVIVAIDRDFLTPIDGEGSLADSRGYAAGRRVLGPDDPMSRVYAVESMMTLTGGAADHRLRLNAGEIAPFTAALANAVLSRLGGSAGGASALRSAVAQFESAPSDMNVDANWLDAVAEDLVEHQGRSVVLAGAGQPPAVHAITHALNAALGNAGETVRYLPLETDEAASSLESIRTLSRDIDSGSVDTLVVIGGNPVYDAPADLNFAEKYGRVATTIHLGVEMNETGAASTWRLNRAHSLESWSDVRAVDGSLSVIQPMIRPLAFETHGGEPGRSELETIALIIGDTTTDGYEIVRRTWREGPLARDGGFEGAWRRVLHDGVLSGSQSRAGGVRVDFNSVAGAAREIEPASGGLQAVIRPSPLMFDGRFANNGWLQELAHPVTKVAWDNPVLLSPAKAKELRINDGDMVRVTVDGRSLDIAAFRLPGIADDTIVLELGYGREHVGPVGQKAGFNTFALRGTGSMRRASGVQIEKVGGKYEIACIQTHWSMEGRPILLEADVQAWRKHHEAIVQKDTYGRKKRLDFSERLTLDAHTPANIDVYEGIITEQQHLYQESPQWGMTIDLSTCSGCSACTIACQAENNIPVVGKPEVAKGREMSWIRVDRYFGAADEVGPGQFGAEFGDGGPYTGGRLSGDVDMMVQPMACVHCENAPCETVCPVNATVHDEEGLNVMAYNRCIGTRYCSNNCPYKVRRFNYFDYATKKLHGDYVGKELLGDVVQNQHWIPPRLRERIEKGAGELRIMQYNPNVTVRERGVMEKCTYCIQRIQEARLESKVEKLDRIPDGFFQVACQQACPTESIVFGDIASESSKVSQMRANGRSYEVLAYLNTKPRTSHMLRLRNPNPRIRPPVEDPFHHGGHGDHNGHNGHGDDHSQDAHSRREEGHLMSLPVLSSSTSRVAGAMARIGGLA